MIYILLVTILLSFDTPDFSRNTYNAPSKYLKFSNPLKAMILSLIKVYQGTVSRVQGDVCNFIPSCSHYGYEAIEKKDVVLGMLMASDRIQRCHGFAMLYVNRYYSVAVDSIRGIKAFDPVKP